jgi:hypothetical protein
MIFYCHHANGDLFEAKSLLEGWRTLQYQKFTIAHKHSKRLFLDQPWLDQIEIEPWMDEQKPWVKSPDGETAVNLWIGRGYESLPGRSTKYVAEGIGIYIEGHFLLHNDIREELDLDPLDGTADDYWPDSFIQNVKSDWDSVLICNGPVRSSQAENFDFTQAILSACKAYPKVKFFVTEKTSTLAQEKLHNIAFTDDLFDDDCDLPEICVLSRGCRLIVGRKSGPHVWAQSRTNLLDPTKTFLSFTVGPAAAWNVHPDNPKVQARRKWMAAKTEEEAESGLLETLAEVFTVIDKPTPMD